MTDVRRDLAATLVHALRADGADTMFGVPGGGVNLELVGAAEDAGMRFVLAHGETASCIMAATYATLTDQVGISTMTRGPGAASAVNGAAQATLDRAPLLVVTDTVASAEADRVPHQRLDQHAMFSPVAKYSATIGAGAALDLAESCVALARTAPAGAVHLDVDPTAASSPAPEVPATPGEPEPARLERAGELIGAARRPVLLIGTEAARWVEDLRRFVEQAGCPFLTTYQARGLISDRSPHAAGVFTNGAIERPLIESADLVLAAGLDPVELIPRPWAYEAPLVSLMPWSVTDPYYEPDVEVVGSIGASLCHLAPATDASGWDDDEAAAHRRRALDALRGGQRDGDAGLEPADVVEIVDQAAVRGSTFTIDAGAHMLVAVPLLTVTEPRGLLISNGLATMGYAVPAAIGASLARPDRPVVALTGDGGLEMVLAELETIARRQLDITIVVFDDAALSLIEIKQGPRHGGRGAVRYGDVDFAAIAEAMGIPAARVHDRRGLEEELSRSENGPHLIDAVVDPSSYRHVIEVTRG